MGKLTSHWRAVTGAALWAFRLAADIDFAAEQAGRFAAGRAMMDFIGSLPATIIIMSAGLVLIGWDYLRWKRRRGTVDGAPWEGVPMSKDTFRVGNVTSHGQTGGVTAGVYVHQAPAPSVKVSRTSDWTKEPDGRFRKIYEARVESGGNASGLTLYAGGDGVEELQVYLGGSQKITGDAGLRDGAAFFEVGHPVNALRGFAVLARKPTNVEIRAEFS
jgi:hypothetical protein